MNETHETHETPRGRGNHARDDLAPAQGTETGGKALTRATTRACARCGEAEERARTPPGTAN